MEIKKADERYNEILAELGNYRTEERKLEFLENVLKKEQDPVVRKYVFILMGSFQSQKKWYGTAAKAYTNAADLSNTFDEKQDLYMKAGVMFIRTGDYFTADDTFRKVLVLAKKSQRKEMQDKVLNLYVKYAEECESNRQMHKALQVYNRILTYGIPLDEANGIRDRIAGLYERMGKPIDANAMRSQKESARIVAEREAKEKKPVEEEDDEFSVEDLLS